MTHVAGSNQKLHVFAGNFVMFAKKQLAPQIAFKHITILKLIKKSQFEM
jgi:hypothetical protein